MILTPIKAGFHDLVIEGDNINVRSKTLYAEYGLFTTLAYFVQEIKTLVVGLRRGSFSYVRRSGNSMAHSLTKLVKSIFDDVIWIEDPPPLALEVLFFDVNIFLL